MYVGLDFETFSSVDIRKHGAARYFESPDFTVLLAAVSSGNRPTGTMVFDFVTDPDARSKLLTELKHASVIVAHNASFERAVCRRLGFDLPQGKFVDSAVLARAAGAGSKLEAAAPQLLEVDKMAMGAELIRVFSVPTENNGGKPYSHEALLADDKLYRQWSEFIDYCLLDARLSYELYQRKSTAIPHKEMVFELLTQQQNDRGWFVDLPLVHEMQRRYKNNTRDLEARFRFHYDPNGELNLNSYQQLQRWCADRGVRAKSFDQQAVPKMYRQIQHKLMDPAFIADRNRGGLAVQQQQKYFEVLALLELKKEMGGSSLSKLQTILDMTSSDGRLRNQYMHVGAGQTFRTSGRGVQLQNLARLANEPGDMSQLYDDNVHWGNETLARNIRQVFRAEHDQGVLVVGDFSSVESRGLAFLAGEQWKLDAYKDGKDIYKLLAMSYASNAGTAYDDVSKAQRQGGKVGELACGYGAGPGAVQGFAEKMGIDMTDEESANIVVDWRAANPRIVDFWRMLDDMLRTVLTTSRPAEQPLAAGGYLRIQVTDTPVSLQKQHPGARSLMVSIVDQRSKLFLARVFHGCYFRGKDVCYYKPSELKGGELWRARMSNPPHAWYKLYGGKLAGILTQSFCRELFFHSMQQLEEGLKHDSNTQIIGQFHDELVVEWSPDTQTFGRPDGEYVPLQRLIDFMTTVMSMSSQWPAFPLEAEVKHAHRYIK